MLRSQQRYSGHGRCRTRLSSCRCFSETGRNHWNRHKDLLEAGEVVIASGGGGIPVIRRGNHLKGVGAVIDKDFASCLLAQQLNADFLIILTAVEKVALRFGTPEETWLNDISVEEAKQYMEEGHFAPGSMLPKVQAAVEFAESGEGRTALITLLAESKRRCKRCNRNTYHQKITILSCYLIDYSIKLFLTFSLYFTIYKAKKEPRS